MARARCRATPSSGRKDLPCGGATDAKLCVVDESLPGERRDDLATMTLADIELVRTGEPAVPPVEPAQLDPSDPA